MSRYKKKESKINFLMIFLTKNGFAAFFLPTIYENLLEDSLAENCTKKKEIKSNL